MLTQSSIRFYRPEGQSDFTDPKVDWIIPTRSLIGFYRPKVRSNFSTPKLLQILCFQIIQSLMSKVFCFCRPLTCNREQSLSHLCFTWPEFPRAHSFSLLRDFCVCIEAPLSPGGVAFVGTFGLCWAAWDGVRFGSVVRDSFEDLSGWNLTGVGHLRSFCGAQSR